MGDHRIVIQLNCYSCRDLRETRQRFDSVGSEIKRKDLQIRELQQRLEVNEGCKCRTIIFYFIFLYFIVQYISADFSKFINHLTITFHIELLEMFQLKSNSQMETTDVEEYFVSFG